MKTRRTKAQRVAMQIERIPMHYRRMCQAEYKLSCVLRRDATEAGASVRRGAGRNESHVVDMEASAKQ
jgi:hypothetical protein